MSRKTLFCMAAGAFLLTLTLGSIQAQAAAVETSKGSKALIFQFNGLSDLSTSAYKGGIGVRKYIQDMTAIRAMVLFGISSDKDNPIEENDVEIKDTDTSLGAELTIEKHLAGSSSVSPYVGGQAGFSYLKGKMEAGTAETTSTSTNFGVGVVAGFEWGFTEAVTLGGEYSVSASFGSGENKVGDTKVSDTSRTDIGIGTASLFVSIGWK